MAGSRTLKQYTTDANIVYNTVTDESNAEAVNGQGFILSLAPTSNADRLPSGFSRRYVLATLQSNEAIKRKFYVGNRLAIPGCTVIGANLNAPVYPNTNDDDVVGENWTITAYRGEKASISPDIVGQEDTGLIDGDLVG